VNKPRLGRSSPPAPGLTGVAATLMTVLWVALVFTSVLVVPFALWCNFSLARVSQLNPHTNTSWLWLLSLVVTLGLPLGLAAWKHGGDARRMWATTAWLPLTWNVGGLLLATQFAPEALVTALRSQDSWAAQRFGDSHKLTRVLSAIGHGMADRIDPPEDVPAVEPPAPAPVRATAATEIAVPFSAAGNAILMSVELRGPAGRTVLPYLFDTGASFTTVNTKTAEKLGLDVPQDAPTLQFNTASGPRESRMVYLPALRLGDTVLEGLLVSVCDGCVNERTEGLLGLNVMREFFVQMDYQAERMHLIPRQHEGRPNRAYDIGPTVKLDVEGTPEIWLGRIRWILLIENRGTVAIEGVIPEVQFSNGQRMRGAAIGRIEPGKFGRSLVEGKTQGKDEAGKPRADKDELGFTLTVAEAYW
jgi:clan AA aspartic protease (TIGR02281 family)